jgi:2-phosphosulfolactate phosphatase
VASLDSRQVATFGGRRDLGSEEDFSLSPLRHVGVAAGTRVVLPSRNSAACSLCAGAGPHLFAGALVNAQAVAAVLAVSDGGVTVVACGERWPEREAAEDGGLRVVV